MTNLDYVYASKAVVVDPEGCLVVLNQKGRAIVFRLALEYLVERLGYSETIQFVNYPPAHLKLNGNFWIHNNRCCIIELAKETVKKNVYYGLQNLQKSSVEFAELSADGALDVDHECQRLRDSMEATLVAAVFEETFKQTPEEAKNIYDTLRNKKYGGAIREKLVADCRAALHHATYESPELRTAIINDPSEFLEKRELGTSTLKISRAMGKKCVIKSHYDQEYTNAIMSYVLGTPRWSAQFDVVMVGCGQGWMEKTCVEKLVKVDSEMAQLKDGKEKKSITGNIYTGGSAEKLMRHLGLKESDVVYLSTDAVAVDLARNHHRWLVSLEDTTGSQGASEKPEKTKKRIPVNVASYSIEEIPLDSLPPPITPPFLFMNSSGVALGVAVFALLAAISLFIYLEYFENTSQA